MRVPIRSRQIPLLVALSAAILPWTGCGGEREEGAVAAPSAEDVAGAELRVVDSIGVEVGDSLYMFGAIEDLVHAPDGNIVVHDRAYSRIMVYSPEGEFIRQIGRQGSGPGELSMTAFMGITGDGNIYVTQRGAMDRFDYFSGEWIEEYPRGMAPPPFCLRGLSDSSYLGVFLQFAEDDEGVGLDIGVASFEPGPFRPVRKYLTDHSVMDPNDAAGFLDRIWFGYNIAFDGSEETIYIARRSTENYEIIGFSIEGEQVFRLERDLPRVERTEEEMDAERDFRLAQLESMDAGGMDYQADPYRPFIAGLGVDGEGRIWVRRGTDTVPTFDVFDPESGEQVLLVTVPEAGENGLYWKVSVDSFGFLAYDENPEQGWQQVHVLELVVLEGSD